MKTNFIKTAVIAVCLSSVALPSYALDLFGWLKKDNSIDSMVEYIPADTALFFGGVTDKNLVSSSDEILAQYGTATSDITQSLAAISDSLPSNDGVDLLSWLMTDYYTVLPEGGEALYKHYGFAVKGASVFYLDGLYPVARIALKDEDAFINLLKKGATENNVELDSTTLEGQTLSTIELVNESELTLKLGILVKNKVLTLSVFSQNDNTATLAQRFALTKPAKALAANVWKDDAKTYNFTKQSHGYISLLNIANGILDSNSTAYQQFTGFKDVESAEFTAFQDQCQADIINLVSGMPRIIMGINRYDVNGDDASFDFTYGLEIKHADILSQLQKLRGFVPSYLTTNNDLAFGMGLGLSADALSPVVTNLWTQFTQAEFNCDVLVGLQIMAKQKNPAMLAMVTGLAQGLSGVSIGVFDVQPDEESMTGLQTDIIATLTAEKPEVLVSLASNYLPFPTSTEIPTDGTAINLADSGLPMDIFVSLKGKHIVAYTGEKSKQVAEQLAAETSEPNGITALALDYPKLADIAINAAEPLSVGMETNCTDIYTSAAIFKALPLNIKAHENITGNGFESTWTIEMTDFSSLWALYNPNIVGEYSFEYLDEECTWVELGTEQLKEDGTGLYSEQDESGSCNIYESHYTWTNVMGAMTQTITENKYRDDCESEWAAEEFYDFSCQVLGKSKDGFYCLQDDSDEKTLNRYVAK